MYKVKITTQFSEIYASMTRELRVEFCSRMGILSVVPVAWVRRGEVAGKHREQCTCVLRDMGYKVDPLTLFEKCVIDINTGETVYKPGEVCCRVRL